MADTIRIEVVYAKPGHMDLTALDVPAGTTLAAVLERSGVLERHGLSAQGSKFGIYGKHATPETVLRDHDRVEIYRPLVADPKEIRKARAAERKAAKRAKAKAETQTTSGTKDPL